MNKINSLIAKIDYFYKFAIIEVPPELQTMVEDWAVGTYAKSVSSYLAKRNESRDKRVEKKTEITDDSSFWSQGLNLIEDFIYNS